MIVGELARSETSASSEVAFARPKSSTFTLPVGVTLMFDGFKSRWTMPRSCAASSASASCRAMARASFQWKHAEGDPVRQRGPLDQFEDERQRATRDSSSPWMCAMFGWFRVARSSASRWNLATRLRSVVNVSGRTLIAMSRFKRMSRAR